MVVEEEGKWREQEKAYHSTTKASSWSRLSSNVRDDDGGAECGGVGVGLRVSQRRPAITTQAVSVCVCVCVC